MTHHKHEKIDTYLGEAGPIKDKKDSFSFIFSDDKDDWITSKHLKMNRKNKYRYLKKNK
jgi:hypothetical protein